MRSLDAAGSARAVVPARRLRPWPGGRFPPRPGGSSTSGRSGGSSSKEEALDALREVGARTVRAELRAGDHRRGRRGGLEAHGPHLRGPRPTARGRGGGSPARFRPTDIAAARFAIPFDLQQLRPRGVPSGHRPPHHLPRPVRCPGRLPAGPYQACAPSRSEPVDRWMLFITNQGTDDHVITEWSELVPNSSYLVEGEVSIARPPSRAAT